MTTTTGVSMNSKAGTGEVAMTVMHATIPGNPTPTPRKDIP